MPALYARLARHVQTESTYSHRRETVQIYSLRCCVVCLPIQREVLTNCIGDHNKSSSHSWQWSVWKTLHYLRWFQHMRSEWIRKHSHSRPGCKEDAQVLWKNVKEEYFGDGCKRFSENDCIEAVEKKLTIDDDLTHIERAHGYLESLFKVVDSPCLDRVPGGQTDPLLE